MILFFRKDIRFKLIGLLFFVPVVIFLSCTSAYHGPLRFSYENRSGDDHDRKLFSDDKPASIHRASNISDSEKVTCVNGRDYILRRTANNLWHLAEKPPAGKSQNDFVKVDCCRRDNYRSDSTFCHSAINTFCDLTKILVNLTGFNPIIRACLLASLKYIKPLLYLMCTRDENNLYPESIPLNRT